DVAPINATGVAEINRPFAPAHAGREPFDTGKRQPILVEARIQHLNRRVGVALARLPARRGPRRGGGNHRYGADCRHHVASRGHHSPPYAHWRGCWAAMLLRTRGALT